MYDIIMNNNSSAGINTGGVLTIIFVVLKLLHIIEWSWLWVLSPMWISLLLYLTVFFIAILSAGE